MTAYSKFWAAFIMAILAFLREHYNVDIGIDEDMATALVGLVTAVLVYAVPNKAR